MLAVMAMVTNLTVADACPAPSWRNPACVHHWTTWSGKDFEIGLAN